MRKFVYAIALVALSISSCQDLTIERSNNSTIKIGKVSIVNSSFKTKVSSGTNVTTEGEVIVEESIEASETPLTKASEIVSLGDFYLEGYLDRSIENKVAASYDDKTNPHFINKALVSKGDNGWSIAGAPTWRNMVEHYFWAYAGSEIELSPVVDKDYTKMSFSYNSQENDGDLIVAYTSQGGNVDHSDHVADAKDNYIESLVFNHALAEIVIDDSGLAAKEDAATDVDPNRTLTVKPSLYSIISDADCVIGGSDGSFVWSEGEVSDVFDLDVNTPNFIIPQKKAPILELNIIDDLTGSSFPHTAELVGGSWDNGYRYTYKLSSTIIVPHYQKESGIEGFGFSASGNKPANELVGGLQSKYIKTIDMEWIGLPKGSGSGDYLIFYLADGTLTKDQVANSNIAKGTQLSGTINGVNYYVIVKCHVKGALTTTSPEGTTVEVDGSKITVSDILLPDDGKTYNLYGYYEGGSNGGSDHKNSNLILQGLNVTISQRRY